MRRQAEAAAAEPSELPATGAAPVDTVTLVEAGAGSVATARADPSFDEPASSELALEPASATVGAGAVTDDGWSDTATDVAAVAPAGGGALAAALETVGTVDTVESAESVAAAVVAAGAEPIALPESVDFAAGSPEATLTGTV